MSWLMARYYDRFMLPAEDACLRDWRSELLGRAKGRVLEIGAGTGINLPHYSDGVESLTLVEPEAHMRAQLSNRLSSAPSERSAEVIEASARSLPIDAGSIDTVVSTLVLCSVDDVDATLKELHRCLRPGGQLLFIEHVAAEDRPDRLKWQRRLEPIWKRLFENCHLTRRTESSIEQAGFDIEHIERGSMRKAAPWVRPSIRGVAKR